MNSISDILKNESPTDVVLSLVRGNGISHPRLDNLYNRNNWVNLGGNLQLMILINNMMNEGLIQHGKTGYIQGPNWREPEFLTQKKYKFDTGN